LAGIKYHRRTAGILEVTFQAMTFELVQARVLPIRRALIQGIISND